MSRLRDAISWCGQDVTLSLFVVWRADPGDTAPVHGSGTAPHTLRTYRLEDPERRLGTRELYEYDLIFDRVPPGLHEVVRSWLIAAVGAGALAAWFAFEGSFDFEHLLTADIAAQVFAVADEHSLVLALEDERRDGPAWAEELRSVRDRLLT